jgi:hypothetical protein
LPPIRWPRRSPPMTSTSSTTSTPMPPSGTTRLRSWSWRATSRCWTSPTCSSARSSGRSGPAAGRGVPDRGRRDRAAATMRGWVGRPPGVAASTCWPAARRRAYGTDRPRRPLPRRRRRHPTASTLLAASARQQLPVFRRAPAFRLEVNCGRGVGAAARCRP